MAGARQARAPDFWEMVPLCDPPELAFRDVEAFSRAPLRGRNILGRSHERSGDSFRSQRATKAAASSGVKKEAHADDSGAR